MEKIRDKMKGYVKLYEPFQNYLESIVNEAKNEFQSIAGIFNRYEALIAARQSLEEHHDKNLHTLETTGVQLVSVVKRIFFFFYCYKNKIYLFPCFFCFSQAKNDG